jgi:hypothetical protein
MAYPIDVTRHRGQISLHPGVWREAERWMMRHPVIGRPVEVRKATKLERIAVVLGFRHVDGANLSLMWL